VVTALETVLGLGSAADLLRLLAVPAFGWAAYRDVKTRRVPNRAWVPLVALGVLALALDFSGGFPTDPFERQLVYVRVGVSVGVVAPLGYVFYRIGGFGGADAKAVLVLALLFPLYPVYYLPFDAFPVHRATLGVFSLTVFTNTVVVGVCYPLALALANLLRGRLALPMLIGKPVPVPRLATAYGSLLETPEGYTRSGLDIDALRMYLRWRKTTLADLRAAPARYRDPGSIPAPGERGRPGDGAVEDGPPVGGEDRSGRQTPTDGGEPVGRASSEELGGGEPVEDPSSDVTPSDVEDPWGAEAFLADIDGTAYGTSPRKLREGLSVLAEPDREAVWMTPGIPFIVPMFVGLVVALTYGDVLFVLLRALGVVP
jgi:preflagellin peptidase FlaK